MPAHVARCCGALITTSEQSRHVGGAMAIGAFLHWRWKIGTHGVIRGARDSRSRRAAVRQEAGGCGVGPPAVGVGVLNWRDRWRVERVLRASIFTYFHLNDPLVVCVYMNFSAMSLQPALLLCSGRASGRCSGPCG